MDKAKNASVWTEQGYSLFAGEGLDGIQVERLARILQLNKSGFYHYFGDLEGYCEEIVKLHHDKVDHFLEDVGKVNKVDPDYLLVLVKHATTVMVQVQCTRHKHCQSLYQASEVVDRKLNSAVQELWSDYLDVTNNPDLVIRYFSLVRDMFYTRISFENLNYPFLHNMAAESRQLVAQLISNNELHRTVDDAFKD